MQQEPREPIIPNKNSMSNQASFTKGQPTEGELTKKIEKVTAKIPSVGYLGLAIGSMALSIGFALTKERKDIANFVGLWVPSFLLLGIYNKIVKTEGSDQHDKLH